MAPTRVPLRTLALAQALALALVGCIALPEPESVVDETPVDNRGGSMTADERKSQEVELCDGASVLGGGGDRAWCATLTITVTGTMTAIASMDVQLDSFNGDVVAKGTPGDKWGFVATLTARGGSEQEALSRLDDIDFTWLHESNGEHVVHVEAIHEGRDGNNIGADIEATLPAAIVYDMSAATANGDVELDGLKTTLLNAASSNGDITATAEFVHANMATSNGDVVAKLTPSRTGDMNVASSNGKIDVRLPEGPRYGYDLEGATSNGEVEIGLTDGEKGPCPQGSEYYTPPCTHRTFQTNSYRQREIRSQGYFATSNGDVSLDKA